VRALLALAACCALTFAGCARDGQKEASGDKTANLGPAKSEPLSVASVAMMRSQFESHKEEWRTVLKGHDSPLPLDKVDVFEGPEFAPYDPSWRFVGGLERLPGPRTVPLPDNRGKTQTYMEYARYPFERMGRVMSVLVYRPIEHPEQFFIPFADSTNGQETYQGGRYVHLDSLGEQRFALDFNKAYNPYCAYDEHWACPLPPTENHMPAAIRAGMLYTPVP
jgi:uncharacterized protein (DUF1684 family)